MQSKEEDHIQTRNDSDLTIALNPSTDSFTPLVYLGHIPTQMQHKQQDQQDNQIRQN